MMLRRWRVGVIPVSLRRSGRIRTERASGAAAVCVSDWGIWRGDCRRRRLVGIANTRLFGVGCRRGRRLGAAGAITDFLKSFSEHSPEPQVFPILTSSNPNPSPPFISTSESISPSTGFRFLKAFFFLKPPFFFFEGPTFALSFVLLQSELLVPFSELETDDWMAIIAVRAAFISASFFVLAKAPMYLMPPISTTHEYAEARPSSKGQPYQYKMKSSFIKYVKVKSAELASSTNATSAADCSAALRLKNPGRESYLSLFTITVDLKNGSWEGPSLIVS
ncbi:leukotriene A-4 hydrolase [Striga asiatica]|uniref:Leukotriene A-4 hydrolase n=1 Tax=Striga asiatica TaxID=4170 RepID=A0A5A7PWQ8_STRAF|nr:leukotriene A-4 hydrolase [Striga asiatica]